MLKTLIESPDYPDITWGLRLAEANISRSGKILSFPLFCVFLMRRILRELDFPRITKNPPAGEPAGFSSISKRQWVTPDEYVRPQQSLHHSFH